jgi:hypothetical protein
MKDNPFCLRGFAFGRRDYFSFFLATTLLIWGLRIRAVGFFHFFFHYFVGAGASHSSEGFFPFWGHYFVDSRVVFVFLPLLARVFLLHLHGEMI